MIFVSPAHTEGSHFFSSSAAFIIEAKNLNGVSDKQKK